jgi:hypothetical protein
VLRICKETIELGLRRAFFVRKKGRFYSGRLVVKHKKSGMIDADVGGDALVPSPTIGDGTKAICSSEE